MDTEFIQDLAKCSHDNPGYSLLLTLYEAGSLTPPNLKNADKPLQTYIFFVKFYVFIYRLFGLFVV